MTLRDVAARAGVSVSVVSRVLNADPSLRVRSDTRSRVLAAAEVLKYSPNHAARALRLSQAGAIGLIVPDVTSAIFAEVLRGVEQGADESGLIVLLGRSERLQPGSDYLRRLVNEGRVDGYLVQRLDTVRQHDFEETIGRNLPLVLINSRGSRHGSVVLDDEAGARVATDHLIELGHTEIGLIGGVALSYTGRMRERGYRLTLSAAGVRRRREWTTRLGYAPRDGYLGFVDLWQNSRRRPTAVVVANVNAALGVLYAARELGVDVPAQLSVVSVHDTWDAEYAAPGLTAVRMPRYELGLHAARDLTARLNGEAAVDSMVTDPEPLLVLRGTTAAPEH